MCIRDRADFAAPGRLSSGGFRSDGPVRPASDFEGCGEGASYGLDSAAFSHRPAAGTGTSPNGAPPWNGDRKRNEFPSPLASKGTGTIAILCPRGGVVRFAVVGRPCQIRVPLRARGDASLPRGGP
eukprot:5313853-Pyramimonas_sp.AAC.1